MQWGATEEAAMQLRLLLAGVCFAGCLVELPAAAQPAPEKPANACVDLSRMRSTKAVDNRTIVVTMRGNEYRKIGLASKCIGLRVQDSFAYETSLTKLCPGDIITVLGGGGDRCGIAEITPLAATEAKELMARKPR
jgi:hypothetical protein